MTMNRSIDPGFAVFTKCFPVAMWISLGALVSPIGSCSPPSWLPPSKVGVIGVVDAGSQHVYGTSQAMLMGGNAVISRAVLQKVGLYATDLGRKGDRPLADEDTDMYMRLLAAGARGIYVPDLVYLSLYPSRPADQTLFS